MELPHHFCGKLTVSASCTHRDGKKDTHSAIGPSTRDLVLSLNRGSANKGEDDSRGLHGGRGKIDEESEVGKSFEVQTPKEIRFQLQVTKR
jgi:hypothetical protein